MVKIARIVFQVLSYWTDKAPWKLGNNLFLSINYNVSDNFLIQHYFLICANCGVDHKTVSSSSMWLAGGRLGAIQEYFFVWVTQRCLLSVWLRGSGTCPRAQANEWLCYVTQAVWSFICTLSPHALLLEVLCRTGPEQAFWACLLTWKIMGRLHWYLTFPALTS